MVRVKSFTSQIAGLKAGNWKRMRWALPKQGDDGGAGAVPQQQRDDILGAYHSLNTSREVRVCVCVCCGGTGVGSVTLKRKTVCVCLCRREKRNKSQVDGDKDSDVNRATAQC